MSTSVVSFRKPTQEDIDHVADNMRPEDVIEVWLSHRFNPLEALESSVANSVLTSCVIVDDEPVAILGLVIANHFPKTGCPWLLATDKALRHKRYFLELSKPVIEEMSEMCPTLYNYVHVENRVSIRWLKWLGFKFSDPEPYGRDAAMFCRFELERGN